MVVNIQKITLKFYGLGLNDNYQACVYIYDISNKLIIKKQTYNSRLTVCLKENSIYKLVAKSYNDKISSIFYVNKYINNYSFIFKNTLCPKRLRTITFLLTDDNYNHLPIMKGKLYL